TCEEFSLTSWWSDTYFHAPKPLIRNSERRTLVSLEELCARRERLRSSVASAADQFIWSAQNSGRPPDGQSGREKHAREGSPEFLQPRRNSTREVDTPPRPGHGR